MSNDPVALEQELMRIVDAFVVLSPVSFQFGGEPPVQADAIPAFIANLPSHPIPPDPLVRGIQSTLYSRCYMKRIDDPPTPVLPSSPDFPGVLSAANVAQERWDSGWQVYQVGQNGVVFAAKGDRRRSAVPGEYISTGTPGFAPAAGSYVTLRVARESHTTQNGFYFMFSEILPDMFDDSSLVRFYFHATPECARDLIAHLTHVLNRYMIPYRMKALSDPPLYGRTDAAVLYSARRYFAIVTRLLHAIPDEIVTRLGSATPLFTTVLRRGIGVAEEPNTGESFGMHRCRLVAEGIVDAWRQGQVSSVARLRAIAARFMSNGLRLDRPHMNSGSVDLSATPAEGVAA